MNKNQKRGIFIAVILAIGIFSYFIFTHASTVEIESIEGGSEKILAGNSSKYIEFNQMDYENSISENKIILLYFYASWCPICMAEQQETFAAFNELENDKVIGFRVNYKDSATDKDEENIAEEFGIPYQHTKVIVHNGKQVLKSLEQWNKERYLEELNKFS